MISNSRHYEVQALEEHFASGLRVLEDMRDPKRYLGFLQQECGELELFDDWKSSSNSLEIDSHWIQRPYKLFGLEIFRLDLARVVEEPWCALRQHREVPYHMAPIDCAIFPLQKKDNLPEHAEKVKELLERDFIVDFDESGSIGKRYLRAAEAGTPYAITIDYDSLKENTVTLRDRDSEKQIRVEEKELKETLRKLLSGERNFSEKK